MMENVKPNQQISSQQGWANQSRVELVTQVAFVPENKVRFAPTCVMDLPNLAGVPIAKPCNKNNEQIAPNQPFSSKAA